MVKVLRKGTLVHVLPENLLNNQDEATCADHGYLWIVRRASRRGQTYRCTALATGKECIWFGDEIAEPNDG